MTFPSISEWFISVQPGFSVDLIGNALVVSFNRPNIRNPLSTDIVEGLLNLIKEVRSASLSKVIFTGSGDAFASGADLQEVRELTAEHAGKFALRGQLLMSSISKSPVPTIAAINGYCFGGGLDLALACRTRIASPNAVFCHPGVGLGIITGWGGTQRLPRLVGEARALEMLLTASHVVANEALRIGLVDEVAEDVVAAALER